MDTLTQEFSALIWHTCTQKWEKKNENEFDDNDEKRIWKKNLWDWEFIPAKALFKSKIWNVMKEKMGYRLGLFKNRKEKMSQK